MTAAIGAGGLPGIAIVKGAVFIFGTLIASGPGGLVEIVSAAVSGGAVKIGNGLVDVLSGGFATLDARANRTSNFCSHTRRI